MKLCILLCYVLVNKWYLIFPLTVGGFLPYAISRIMLIAPD
ncbi:hypothetical protein HMPREF0766_12985 [Sphingobacterium spiritivorum ATCC 33861]|uniref:Uncharacterized protein n=1 Tax=Sphingobacterium spiritivorum ATCC 33861 TaxID=525373 RepID=D7VPR5_SPHSI|nr:hypothetical protein HMPREF0766_12985 [Sphingobacterium spiritivorum ATCC 33861]